MSFNEPILRYLLVAAIVIGLVVLSGCIAVPAEFGNQTAAQEGSRSIGSVPDDNTSPQITLQPGEGSHLPGTSNLTVAKVPSEEGGQTAYTDITDNQTPTGESLPAGQSAMPNETTGTWANPTYTEPATPVGTVPVTGAVTPSIPVEDKLGVLVPQNPLPIETHHNEPPMLSDDDEPLETMYREIYHDNVTFSYSTIAFSYNLNMPPLIIEYTVWPKMIKDTKAFTSRFGKKEDEVVSTTFPSPDAWFEIVARDKTTGEVVLKNGYGRDYEENLNQKAELLKTGDYQIDFHGNDVTVDIRILATE